MTSPRQLFHLTLLTLFAFTLTSCSHFSRKDGAPKFYVDETKIPDAVPKPEPLAKYGNMKSYVVFGKRYFVMKNPKHYNEVGIASWYGTKFHERRTSSGEPYNMLGMTAAHKTLPLPTYVEVTNLKNNRKIIVKVNDRGPFATGRIIDLTYVAAKKLGMIGKGTTYVRVKAIDPNTYNKPVLFAAHNKNRYASPAYSHNANSYQSSLYLQVGAFRERSHALRLRRQLAALVSAPVNIHAPPTKGGLYRVKIGPIHDVDTAENISHRLKRLGMTANRTHGA